MSDTTDIWILPSSAKSRFVLLAKRIPTVSMLSKSDAKRCVESEPEASVLKPPPPVTLNVVVADVTPVRTIDSDQSYVVPLVQDPEGAVS